MYYKKCPFCGSSIKERYDNKNHIFIMECLKCKEKGIFVKAIAETINELQELWNGRNIIDDVREIGKTNYGYLILQNNDIIECNDSHPEELLKYFGIVTEFNEYNNFDLESFCKKSGILRICEHCNCIMIDIPNKTNKKQIDRCIKILENYKNYTNFCIYVNNEMLEANNVSDCILNLDRIK